MTTMLTPLGISFIILFVVVVLSCLNIPDDIVVVTAFSPSYNVHAPVYPSTKTAQQQPSTASLSSSYTMRNTMELQLHSNIKKNSLFYHVPAEQTHTKDSIALMSTTSMTPPSTVNEEDGTNNSIVNGTTASLTLSQQQDPFIINNNSNGRTGIVQKLKSYLLSVGSSSSSSSTATNENKVSTKERLAKMGLAAVLSYGWVSNMSYSVSVSIAWYIFSRKTGVSPLEPGQWKGFLAVYAGFWIFNNIVRPVRIGISIAISPFFDKIIISFQKRLNISKPSAIALTVILGNVVGTISFMSAGIVLASLLSGVPIFPTKTIPI